MLSESEVKVLEVRVAPLCQKDIEQYVKEKYNFITLSIGKVSYNVHNHLYAVKCKGRGNGKFLSSQLIVNVAIPTNIKTECMVMYQNSDRSDQLYYMAASEIEQIMADMKAAQSENSEENGQPQSHKSSCNNCDHNHKKTVKNEKKSDYCKSRINHFICTALIIILLIITPFVPAGVLSLIITGFNLQIFIITGLAALIFFIALTIICKLPCQSSSKTAAKAQPDICNTEHSSIDKPKIDESIISAIKLLHDYNKNIYPADMNTLITELCDRVDKIIDYLEEHPEKVSMASSFLTCYMDIVNKVLYNYNELKKYNIHSAPCESLYRKTENTLKALVKAFDKQFEKLLQSETLNLEAELDLLHSFLVTTEKQ